VAWNSARGATRAFVGGAANPTEAFSSDGPRRIFYNPDGTPITAGNFLFGTNGGTVLQKPDLTAADGASSKTPGFLPFYGTSAAAPHAAAVAALIKSVRPDYTNVQILNAMKQTALDIRAPGIDRDSGWGIVMALAAANYALAH
jgi:subtilisin family serine protease